MEENHVIFLAMNDLAEVSIPIILFIDVYLSKLISSIYILPDMYNVPLSFFKLMPNRSIFLSMSFLRNK